MASTNLRTTDMDVNEFLAAMEPKAKRSKMEPYRAQIFELKGKGYANWQIKEFLGKNGVDVSTEAIRKFIKSREGKPLPKTASVAHSAAPAARSEKTAEGGNPNGSAVTLETVLEAKESNSKFEAYQATGNSLVNKLKKEKDIK